MLSIEQNYNFLQKFSNHWLSLQNNSKKINMSKLIQIQEAVTKVKSGMTLMIGGFLTVGGPNRLIDALMETDVKDLTLIANDTAYADKGLGKLITARKVKKVITSHIGTNMLRASSTTTANWKLSSSPGNANRTDSLRRCGTGGCAYTYRSGDYG